MNVNFVAIDHEGQGRSAEGRVASHVDNFDNFVEDIKTLIDPLPYTRKHRKPIILMSHSMGGMISAAFAQKYTGAIDGLALSSPMLAIKAPAPLTTEQLGAPGTRMWHSVRSPSRQRLRRDSPGEGLCADERSESVGGAGRGWSKKRQRVRGAVAGWGKAATGQTVARTNSGCGMGQRGKR